MGDEFPQINYVPIDHGSNVGESLMSLFNLYKGISQMVDQNKFLKKNPYQNATNSGALDAAMKIFGGKEGEARSTNLISDAGLRDAQALVVPQEANARTAEAAAATTNAGANVTNAGTEAGRLKFAQDWAGPNNQLDWAKVGAEQENADTSRTNATTDQARAITAEKGVANENDWHKQANDIKSPQARLQALTAIHDNYLRARMTSPTGKLADADEAKADAVDQALFALSGIKPAPTTTPGTGAGGGLPLPGAIKPNSTSSGQSQPTRIGQAVHAALFSKIPEDSFDPLNRILNEGQNIYNTVNPDVDAQGNPTGKSLHHRPGVGDIPADLLHYISKIYNSKRSQ